MPLSPPPALGRRLATPEIIAASLLTSADGAEVQVVARDGRRLRLPADEETARSIALSLWCALDRAS